MNQVDLHIHSTMSDGTNTIQEIIQLCKECGLKYISITDHDTMKGVNEAIQEGNKNGIRVISGMEISTAYKGKEIHVLGYGMNPEDEKLKPIFEYVQKDRRMRNLKIMKKMKEDGIQINLDDITSKEIFGRPHFANILIEQGVAHSVQDAFDRFLADGQKYFVPRSYIPIEQVIQIIHACKGLAILAHPYQYKFSKEERNAFFQSIQNMGMDGMEVYYTGYSSQQIEELVMYANFNHMLITGGSDYHGQNKPHIHLGEVYVPIACAKQFIKSL